MKDSFQERVAVADSLLDVLLILKDKIALDTHVATLAFVDEVLINKNDDNDYGIVKVRPFPLIDNQTDYSIQAYYFNKDIIFNKNDKVIVLFIDTNFADNLSSYTGNAIKSQTLDLHKLNYGIIISTLNDSPISLKNIPGYDKNEKQKLVNDNGTIKWENE